MFISKDVAICGIRRWFLSAWLLLFLIFSLLFSATSSLIDANWVGNSAPMVWGMIIGGVVGVILAYSRFRELPALVFCLVFSIVFNLQAIVRFIPSYSEIAQGGDWIGVMSQRLGILSSRLAEWWGLFRAGEDIPDTRLFVFLMSLLLWLASAWLVWCSLRWSNGWLGCLPIGFVLGINIYQSGQSLWRWVFYCCLLLCIVGITAYRGKNVFWNRKKFDYPEGLGYEWTTMVVSIVIPLVILSRLIVFFGTPEGWDAISEIFRKPQETTDELASQLFSQVKPPSPTEEMGNDRGGFLKSPSLADIGGYLSDSTAMVMWVAISDVNLSPQMAYLPVQVDLNLPKHYWRSGIYSEYTGTGWNIAPAEKKLISAEDAAIEEVPPGKFVLTQTYQLAQAHDDLLFSVNNPVDGDEGISLRMYSTGDTATVVGSATKYQVTSLANDVTLDELQVAGENYPQGILDIYLQLPDTLPDRVRDLAARVAAGARTPYDKTVAIQNYLRENYPYMEDVPRMTGNGDVVDYFLFDAPGGFCSYYSSAMAVMLRSLGIPARVVTGYSMGSFDTARNVFVVRMLNAHAWVEVYFPSYGWVEFEPTTSEEPFEYLPDKDSGYLMNVVTDTEETTPGWTSSTVFWCLRTLGIIALIVLAVALWVRWEWRGADPRLQSVRLYKLMRKGLSWIRLTAPDSATPDEFYQVFERRIIPMSLIDEAVRKTTSIYLISIYSPRPPFYSDVHYARTALYRALPQFVWMAIKYLFQAKKDKPVWKWQEEPEV